VDSRDSSTDRVALLLSSVVPLMTDTDNTGEQAVAWYGPIRLLADKY
jgi:hypothetical protein